MNTVSINNAISKEFGLNKSKKVESSRQLVHNNICYARERVYKWVGDFHCQKYYGKVYHFYVDSKMDLEKINMVADFLKNKLNCELFAVGLNGFSFKLSE